MSRAFSSLAGFSGAPGEALASLPEPFAELCPDTQLCPNHDAHAAPPNLVLSRLAKDLVTTLAPYLQSWDFTDTISEFEH